MSEERKKPGVKPLPIDAKIVHRLAQKMLPTETIASLLGCSVWTLQRRFAQEIELGRSAGKEQIMDMLMDRAKTSDMVLLHVANRFFGPVEQKLDINLKTMPTEKLVEVLEQRLTGKALESGEISESGIDGAKRP